MTINCDCGEGLSDDAALMPYLDWANIACGGHAGDADSMRRTLRLCREYGVQVGAHPSYPDRENFGRHSLAIERDELMESLSAQLAGMAEIAVAEGASVQHVKPHGALYNDAAQSRELAALIAEVVRRVFPEATLVGLAGSLCVEVYRSFGMRTASEAFADRGYLPDGRLKPRSEADALITDPAQAVAQALRFRDEGRADTICVHSDSPNALAMLRALRNAL